jgi:hypothetical protein
MGIDTLMPHLLGVPVLGGRASAPEGADVPCPHHLDIHPSVGQDGVEGGGGMHACDACDACDGRMSR